MFWLAWRKKFNKSYFTATHIKDFLVLEPLGFFALFYFFCKKRLLENSLHVFVLDMPNKKSEVLGQECSKRKVFLQILQNSLENNCVQESLLNEGAGFMDKVKLLRSHFTGHRCFPVKFAIFLTTLLQHFCRTFAK